MIITLKDLVALVKESDLLYTRDQQVKLEPIQTVKKKPAQEKENNFSMIKIPQR